MIPESHGDVGPKRDKDSWGRGGIHDGMAISHWKVSVPQNNQDK